MERDSSSSFCFWLRRTNFSRAICHRTETLAAPLASFDLNAKAKTSCDILGPGRSGTSDSLLSQAGIITRRKMSSVKSKSNDASLSADLDMEPEFSFPSPSSSGLSFSSVSSVDFKTTDGLAYFDFSSPNRDEDSASLSSSMGSSPSSSGVFSRACIQCPCRYSSEDCRDEWGKSEVKRVTSWSDLFRLSGGEHAVSSAENWMIDLSQLFVGQRFACGTYSRLYHGVYKDEAVAIKVMRQPDGDGFMPVRLERLFTQEITLHSQIDHRNIVKFIGACRKPPALCMLTEYLSRGSLRGFLRKANDPLPLKQLLGMALDIASGMEYLHTRGIIHRDLKSENLLLTDDLRVKIADFGVACYETNCELMQDNPGTYRWMAPEMISQKLCTRKVDVFSFGIILYELVSRHVPFEEMSAVQVAFAVVHKNARPEIPPDCPVGLEHLMCQCWSTDSNARPEFWEVLKALQDVKDALKD